MEYTEGPKDKAFMRAQDRKYLKEIARSNPDKFLQMMAGLDLSLPHHLRLLQKYGDKVERMKAERRSGEGCSSRASISAVAAVPAHSFLVGVEYFDRLMAACSCGDLIELEYLLGESLDLLSKTDVDGNTALHKAAEFGRIEACRLLMSRGADMNLSNDRGDTPLDLMKEKGIEVDRLVERRTPSMLRAWCDAEAKTAFDDAQDLTLGSGCAVGGLK